METKIPVTKLGELFPNDCFIITAKCIECGREALVLRDKQGIYLECTDGLGGDIDTGCGKEYLSILTDRQGDMKTSVLKSCLMLGLFDGLIGWGGGKNGKD